MIFKKIGRGKVIIIYGARQVGKTTLLKNLFPQKETLYLACEEERIKEQLIPDSLALRRILGNFKNIILDEAQHLQNPGLILKILVDNFPHLNFIASGSSSFDLAGKVSEPLTGRYYQYQLFPLSLSEIKQNFPPFDIKFYQEQALIFGSYPELFKLESEEEKKEYLTLLTEAYLYKDILSFALVKNSRKIRELLIALSLQIGGEVSYNELANSLTIDRKTVENYLDLLEKSFVVFRLSGFARNLRSEINRKVKVYFYDLGVRNALINNFNRPPLRGDVGAMFENYVVSEMLKKEANKPQRANFYFWRTWQQRELDLILEKQGRLTAYEIKMKRPQKEVRSFFLFRKIYPQSRLQILTPENLLLEIL